MGRIKKAYELTELARIAKAREDAMKARLAAKERTYTPKLAADYDTVYYRDPIVANQILQLTVRKSGITLLGGADDCGLLTAKPDGSSPIVITRGSKVPYARIKWFYGDATVKPEKTPWGTTWLKKYDDKNGQSHYQVPFSIKTGAFTLNTLITKFGEYFNETNGTKRTNALGANGQAQLEFGYGSQWTILARF